MKNIFRLAILLTLCGSLFTRCTLSEESWYEIEPAPVVRDTVTITPWDPIHPEQQPGIGE